MSQKFKNKVVVVTGGGQGIGKAISQAFATEGACVVIADIDDEAGLENKEYIEQQNGRCLFVHTDVAIEDDVKHLMDTAATTFGGIDVLCNNAGIGAGGTIYTRPMEEWDRVIAVNLRGTYMCAKYAANYMKKNGGAIINIASTRALMSEPNTEPYSASKGGILALTHSLAVSLGSDGIRVNAISPGWIEVSEWKKKSLRKPPILTEIDHKQHPVGRVGRPEDIARACLFLASAEDAGFITGANLVIDGGMTIKMIYAE